MLEYSDEVRAFGEAEEDLAASRKTAFFCQDYKALRQFARRLHCGGLTDYEAPICRALSEFGADRRVCVPLGVV